MKKQKMILEDIVGCMIQIKTLSNHNIYYFRQKICMLLNNISIFNRFPINHEDLENESDTVKSQIFYGLLENKQVRSESKGLQNIMQMDKQIYGYLFVYDVNDHKSFLAIKQVISYISEYCEKKSKYSGFITKKILVCNKYDQVDEKMVQTLEGQMKSLLDKYPMKRFNVSAKSSDNVSTAFEEIGKQISLDIKIEMIEKEWFEERADSIKDIQTQKIKQAADRQHQEVITNNTGVLGCIAKKEDSSDDEDKGYDQEDDEFTNISYYTQSMDDSNEGCHIF